MNQKPPAFQLYVRDWLIDMEEHPLEIEGAWIRICCKLWLEPEQGTATKTLYQWAKILRLNADETRRILTYLSDSKIADVRYNVTDCNENVTVISRRMSREFKDRKANNNRVIRHREKVKRECNAECNENVTLYSSSSSSSAYKYNENFSGEKRLIGVVNEVIKHIPEIIKYALKFEKEKLDTSKWKFPTECKALILTYPGSWQELGERKSGDKQTFYDLLEIAKTLNLESKSDEPDTAE